MFQKKNFIKIKPSYLSIFKKKKKHIIFLERENNKLYKNINELVFSNEIKKIIKDKNDIKDKIFNFWDFYIDELKKKNPKIIKKKLTQKDDIRIFNKLSEECKKELIELLESGIYILKFLNNAINKQIFVDFDSESESELDEEFLDNYDISHNKNSFKNLKTSEDTFLTNNEMKNLYKDFDQNNTKKKLDNDSHIISFVNRLL